jgi:uncharacterized membrane protein YvbJ
MPFCNNCGKEVKEGTKFCSGCGASLSDENESTLNQQHNTPGFPCPKCGSPIPNGSIACIKCGTLINQDSHKAAIIIGYIVTILSTLLIPFAGIIVSIIFAIYLGTRNNKNVRKHGIIMIIIAVIIFIIMLIISYISYMNSLDYYMTHNYNYNNYYY